MSRKKRDLPAHIHESVRCFLAEVSESNYEDRTHVRNLRKVVAVEYGPIVNIWKRAETAYAGRYTRGYLDMPKPEVEPGDGQEWLCRAIMASMPQKGAVATTRKQAEAWQRKVSKKLAELDQLLTAQPESCAGLSSALAANSIRHMETDTSWRGRKELLQHRRALRALFYRYRTILHLLNDAVSDPALIPETYKFDSRPGAKTAERNQFMRELSEQFMSMLGKPKNSWVAHIASEIYGGEPDPKVVRRQLTR